ncbi:MAG: type VI secretion system tip protein TssI/VgrG, partial [Byssovorax sp.]
LSEHGREALNREYLITRIEHQGAEPAMAEAGSEQPRYENRFEVIPSDVPFRPALITARPTVKGVQSAVVVGPAGEEIYTDEHGRVKVQFFWDRLGKKDEKSSCWIRVSQVWAGEGWGAMHIPRINQEVLVDFFEGDPDRPIIVGRVYHGTNVPPYGLPASKTRSTIKSNSTPGGNGSNELRFEDKAGSEEIYLHGQKDWTIAIEHDKNQTVGHDETLNVAHDRSAEVGHDQKETIGNDESFSVGHDRAKTVGHDETESIGHDRTIEVAHDHTESIGNNLTLSVAKAKTEEVGDDSTESVGKTRSLSAGKDYAIDVTSNMTTGVGSNQTTDVKLNKTLTVGEKLTITCGDATITVEKGGAITIDGKDLTVKASGKVNVEATGDVSVKSSGAVKVEATGKVEVKGSGPMELNASGAVKVKGANVGIN